jgi:Ca-activated chloride channel family protein
MRKQRVIQERKRGSRFPWLVLLAIVGIIGWNLAPNWWSSSSAPANVAGGSSAGVVDPHASYARRALSDTWPPLEEAAAPVAGAARLDAVNYYLVLDGSGSMLDRKCSGGLRKIEAAVVALQRFIDSVPADANIGLAVFDGSGLSARVALGADNRDRLRNALSSVRASGGTPLRSAIDLGYTQLLEQGQRQFGYGEYHLVVVTDGQPDPRSENPERVVARILAETPVVLHTVGFCIGTDHVLNQPGRSYYVAADTPDELTRGLDAVLAEAPQFDVARFTN